MPGPPRWPLRTRVARRAPERHAPVLEGADRPVATVGEAGGGRLASRPLQQGVLALMLVLGLLPLTMHDPAYTKRRFGSFGRSPETESDTARRWPVRLRTPRSGTPGACQPADWFSSRSPDARSSAAVFPLSSWRRGNPQLSFGSDPPGRADRALIYDTAPPRRCRVPVRIRRSGASRLTAVVPLLSSGTTGGPGLPRTPAPTPTRGRPQRGGEASGARRTTPRRRARGRSAS